MLEMAGYRATVIDYSSAQIERLSKFGIRAYYGDATRPDLLKSAGIEKARLLIVAIDDKEATNRLVGHVVRHYPRVHVIARAYDRTHVFELWSLGCRDIIRETYDSSLRMGRSAFEALGTTREQAEDLTQVFETADRRSMIELADVFDIDTPPWENQEMIAAIKRLREQMDPLLQDQIAEIMGRDDLRDAAE